MSHLALPRSPHNLQPLCDLGSWKRSTYICRSLILIRVTCLLACPFYSSGFSSSAFFFLPPPPPLSHFLLNLHFFCSLFLSQILFFFFSPSLPYVLLPLPLLHNLILPHHRIFFTSLCSPSLFSFSFSFHIFIPSFLFDLLSSTFSLFFYPFLPLYPLSFSFIYLSLFFILITRSNQQRVLFSFAVFILFSLIYILGACDKNGCKYSHISTPKYSYQTQTFHQHFE